MNENENDKRKPGLADLAGDAAHPFDQTNGHVDGLEGDADDPENFGAEDEGGTVLPAGGPASGLPIAVDPEKDGKRAEGDSE